VTNTKGMVMGYFDGNTVTALWNYAQNFALSDNSYNSNFGPSSPGAINLISGQTNGIIQATANAPSRAMRLRMGRAAYTLIGDAEPLGDTCSNSRAPSTLNCPARTSAICSTRGAYLGLVPGRLRPHRHQSERDHGLQQKHRFADHRADRSRLRGAP
jgi:hypothetical protein